jgi:8-oxo-(d)GTP phosphatase
MKIFVNDILLHLLKKPEANLPGVVLNVSHAAEVMAIYEQIRDTKLSLVRQYHFLPEDYALVKQELKANFNVIEAAGGIVKKGNAILLIKRFGKWDLPKGKLEPGEDKKTAAVREVEEECGVKAKLMGKVGTMWHTYMQGKENTLKKTTWYYMESIDDSRLKPQAAENISKVKWVEQDKVPKLLENSYASICHIYDRFAKQQMEFVG